MAKRGSKMTSQQMRQLTGTDRKCRAVIAVVPPVEERIKQPKTMTAAARRIWKQKIEVYESRGQNIAGMEAVLANYCELEAAIAVQWKMKQIPPMAQLTEYRRLANEFFDTPASQLTRAKPKDSGGRFGNNGV